MTDKVFAKSELEVSAILGISTTTIGKWKLLKGFPAKGSNGYDIDALLQWAINNKDITLHIRRRLKAHCNLNIEMEETDIEQDDFSSATGSPNLERFRKAQADLAELKLAFQSGKLIELDKYILEEASRYNIFKKALEQLHKSLPVRLINLTQDEIRLELQRSFDKLLRQLQREIDGQNKDAS